MPKEPIDEARVEIATDFWGLPTKQALQAIYELDAKLAEVSENEQRSIAQLRKEISDEMMHCNDIDILQSALRLFRMITAIGIFGIGTTEDL